MSRAEHAELRSRAKLPTAMWPDRAADGGTALQGVELADVAVHFGGVSALRDVTLQLPGGGVIAVIGPNGAGKSTLLNAISGILGQNASGDILVEGRKISRLSASARASGIARSFQDPPLIDTMTVEENVMIGGRTVWKYSALTQLVAWRRVATAEHAARERARELLEFVELGHLAGSSCSALPYGPRKLVDIARALMSAPRLLLLDEPTSGLDKGEQATMVRVLAALRDSGEVTVLVVEHHMDVVRNCATQVVGLLAGEVIAHGATNEVLDSDEFRAALVAKA